MILFSSFRMLKTVLQGIGIKPTNPWVKVQQDSARVDIPVRWTGGQGRGWEAQEWHRKMEILCCWASSRSWEIPQFQFASILRMGRRNTAVYEEIKKQFWWEPGTSPGSEHFPQDLSEPWWSKPSTLVTILEQNWSNHTRGKKTEMQRQLIVYLMTCQVWGVVKDAGDTWHLSPFSQEWLQDISNTHVHIYITE